MFMLPRFAEHPERSLPSLFSLDMELEGAYRWFNNDRVNVSAILKPHIQYSVSRVVRNPGLITPVLHDTMDIETAKDVGIRWHHSLAISDAERRIPLGLLSAIPVARHPREKKKQDAPNEFDRWIDGIKNARRAVGHAADIVHVADCEADSFALIAETASLGELFVFRLRYDRTVEAEGIAESIKLSDLSPNMKTVAIRNVKLSPRKRGNKSNADLKAHPLRDGREAKLEVTTANVVFKRSSNLSKELPSEILLTVIKVREVDAPEGEEPVEWLLATNMAVTNAEEALTVVDLYRARWTIEEFHKVLKTGCSLEARQLESQHAVMNLTALLIPVALDILSLKTASKVEPYSPASLFLSEERLKVLAHFSPIKITETPTVREAFLAIAKLGGHIKNNGEPGWLVLNRGYRELLTFERGWQAAKQHGQKM
jgi:hypothetical protein